jgi:hypothetical protein
MRSLSGVLIANQFPEFHSVPNFSVLGNPGYATDDNERYGKTENRV